MQASCRFWQPRAPGVTALGVLAEGFFAGERNTWVPFLEGLVARLCLQGQAPELMASVPAAFCWSSRHSGALASLSQGPRVSGENRSLEEQSSEPAQALNVISSSLNRIGTGAKESAGPPSGSQLSRPGAYLDGCWLPRLHLCSGW